MKETVIKCDICGKLISLGSHGHLQLSGRVINNVCSSIDYTEVCYECTEELFGLIEGLKIEDKS